MAAKKKTTKTTKKSAAVKRAKKTIRAKQRAAQRVAVKTRARRASRVVTPARGLRSRAAKQVVGRGRNSGQLGRSGVRVVSTKPEHIAEVVEGKQDVSAASTAPAVPQDDPGFDALVASKDDP